MKLKQKNGITLVALVVTIIILLILAGVVIGAISGDNGILKKAKEAVNIWKEAEEKELWTNTSIKYKNIPYRQYIVYKEYFL